MLRNNLQLNVGTALGLAVLIGFLGLCAGGNIAAAKKEEGMVPRAALDLCQSEKRYLLGQVELLRYPTAHTKAFKPPPAESKAASR